MSAAAVQSPLLVSSGRRSGRVAASLLLFGAVATGLTVWSAASSPVLTAPTETAGLRAAVVVAYAGAGVLAWWRAEGAERFALVLVTLGLSYALTDMIVSADPTLHSVGRLLNAAWVGLFIYAFLAFPSGRLGGRSERLLIVSYVVGAVVLWPALALIADKVPSGGSLSGCAPNCPGNGLQVWEAPASVAHLVTLLILALTSAVLVGTALLLLGKVRSEVGVERRTVAPVLLAAVLVLLTYVGFSLHPSGGAWPTASRFVGGCASVFAAVAFMVGPLVGELYVSRSLWRGLSRFDYLHFAPGELEQVCRRALGDRSLRLTELDPQRNALCSLADPAWTLPVDAANATTVSTIESNGRRYALVHDPRLARGYQGRVQRVGALAVALVEYARALEEVVSSRERIAAAEGEERRKLERDLHDGAQQYLLALQVRLGLLEQRVTGSELAPRVRDLALTAAAAADEVQRIAHGIYPSTLADEGLAAALRQLPMPPTITLHVRDSGIDRLTRAEERAIYFTILEAIQNATKHAGSTQIQVLFARAGDAIEISIADNGHGFDPILQRDSFGIIDMHDRIESIGGSLRIASDSTGTVIRLTIPVHDPEYPSATSCNPVTIVGKPTDSASRLAEFPALPGSDAAG